MNPSKMNAGVAVVRWVDDAWGIRQVAQLIRALPVSGWAALMALAFIVFSLFTMSFAVDDSFIYLRYAQNLLEHGVWNWNPSGTLVEAYTGALYAFLPIIPVYSGFPAQLFLDLVGLIALLLLVRRVWHDAVDPFLKVFLVAFLLLSPITYIHVYSGLETPVFMLLAYEAFRAYCRASEGQGSHRYFYAVCLALAFVRSDGPVLAGVMFLALLWQSKFELPEAKWFLVVLFVGVAYFAWRYQYFGSLLPAPAYQKLGNGQGMFWFNWLSAKLYVIPLLVLVPCLLWSRDRPALVVSFAALVLVGMYMKGQLEMNFSDRFFYQICIPALIFVCARIEIKDFPLKNIATLALVTLLVGVVVRGLGNEYVRTYTYSLYNSYRVMGDALGKFANRGHSLLAGDCGILPHRSGWRVIDYMGLANMHVARHGLAIEYLRETDPDVLIVYAPRDGEPSAKDAEMASDRTKVILAYAAEGQRYRYVDSFTSGNYYNAMYVKRGLADEEALAAEIKKAASYTKEFFKGDFFSYRKVMDFTLTGKWLSL